MPEYKLTYFNGRGLAELSRWIMHYANIPFTDERIEREDWPGRKKDFTGGKLPVLEVDGKQLPQSMAIARFLATKGGLVPEDPLRAAYCDALVETLREVLIERFKIMRAEDKSEEEKKKTLYDEFMPNTLYPLFDRINKRLESKEWFITDKITWVDIAIGCFTESTFKEEPDLGTKFPKMKAHAEKVQNLPGIKEWLQRRPETPF